MNSSALKWSACGAAVATAAWIALHPRHQEPAPAIKVPPAAAPWSEASLAAALQDLEHAKTGAEKLAAINRLDEIPTGEIPAVLASIETVRNRRLTFAARTLLTRWASKDGPAAMSWAWQNLRKAQAWNEALAEIGPAWAWRDPEGFGTWLKAAMDRRKPELTLSAEVANASEDPVFDMTQVSKATRWLLAGKPSLAFEILKSRPGWSSDDHELVERLLTVEKVREALLAFDGVDRIDVTKPTSDQTLPILLLTRWKEIDPEDFARSPYRDALGRTKFEEIDRMVSSWKSANPDDRAAAAQAAVGDRDEPTRGYAIAKVAAEWAAADPTGAAAWLESLPDSDEAVRDRIYATEISVTDPGSAFRRIAALPPLRYGLSMAKAFDAWRTRRPGQLPDMDGWSDAQRRDWADLEAIASK